MALLREFISQDGMNKAAEDHRDNEYATQGSDVLVRVSGFYTIAELELKLRELKEAQQLFNEQIS